MPAVKRRYYILIFILVLLLFGLSARLYLAELLLATPMQHAGLKDVAVDIKRLTLEHSYLSQISFVVMSNSGRLTVHADEISISYLPGKLIKGRIDTLEINRLSLSYLPDNQISARNTEPESAHKNAPPAEILAVLRTALAVYIPFDQLSIQRITFDGDIIAGLDDNIMQLTSTNDAGVLYAELTLLTEDGGESQQALSSSRVQLAITRLHGDVMKLELRPALATGELPASIRLQLGETAIDGSYQFSPQGVISWLQPFLALQAIDGIDTVNGIVSLDLQDNDLLHGTLTASSKHVSMASSSARNITLDMVFDFVAGETSHRLKLLESSKLTADQISSASLAFTDSHIDLAGELYLSDDGWKYQGTLNSKLLTAAYDTRQTKLSDISVAITADAESLQADGSLSPADLPGQYSFKLDHSLDSAAGSLSLTPVAAIDLTAEEHTISQLLMSWPYPFDLYTGKLKLSASASWSKDEAFMLAGELSLKDIGGNIRDIVFSGLSFDHKLEILPVIRSKRVSQLQIATVDSGVIISDISLSLAATTPQGGPLPRLLVRQAQGKILGGSFSAEDMIYDLNRDKNRLRINLSDVDLAEIVETQQLENIAASGRLDGSLPVEINAQSIVIAHGRLVNDVQGGIIRYIPETGTEQLRQNPLTDITLAALRDFRYSDLRADVNYQPDGKLTIDLELKGISPELDVNRPVHLNINTEQNLTSLLKSLRFARGVSDSIDIKVRRMYEQIHK